MIPGYIVQMIMGEIQHTLQVAQGISDYGTLVMIGAVYIVLSALMMIAIFKWFKTIINNILDQNKKGLQDILEETRKQNDMLSDVAEGLRPETQLRIKNLSGLAFDLSVEQVCKLIKRVREENHISDHEKTAVKIRRLLHNIHEDRKSRFDPFSYRGRCLSLYCNPDWVERVALIFEGEIYNPSGADDSRAYNNVKMVYDDIKIDFYQKMNY